jgi:hypothetical protein
MQMYSIMEEKVSFQVLGEFQIAKTKQDLKISAMSSSD